LSIATARSINAIPWENDVSEPNPPPLPVVLQLAPLPRTQVGPFLLLGVDKDAGREEIEAHWADRIKWARRGVIKIPLEDINWAREMVNSTEQRIRCDAVSLNVETTAGTLRSLRQRYQGTGQGGARPLDAEKWLADYTPATAVPSLEEVRAAIRVPELPRDVPAVRIILENFARAPIDPWQVELDT
jgi:hypothetical protein